MRTASHQGPQGLQQQSQMGKSSHMGQQSQSQTGTASHTGQQSQNQTGTASHSGQQGQQNQSQTGTVSHMGQQGPPGTVSQQVRPETVFRQGRMRQRPIRAHRVYSRGVRREQCPTRANRAKRVRVRRGQRPNNTRRDLLAFIDSHTGRVRHPGQQSWILIHTWRNQTLGPPNFGLLNQQHQNPCGHRLRVHDGRHR